ncbi:uncharacterized protein LTR77_009229 [Saxophila tyrrhenica]|uniref:DUF1593-domain-containing protein n=1 Tax=Saxophila tyrrhenica TaxID=1690608 RepID=A0AAV9NYH2_9PEZI|nr:hypothetical protein LTR77_009229 [Saxophila tyrrhenica]
MTRLGAGDELEVERWADTGRTLPWRWPLVHAHQPGSQYGATSSKIRTVVTTDMEQDDLTSLVRYMLYTPALDTQGLIYSSSRFHWEGDYNGTRFYLPDREYKWPQTSFRWVGNQTMQNTVVAAYSKVYQNLRVHDPDFPTPDEIMSLVKIGNVDFEGEFDHDTEGSNHIRSLILDDDPRTLYLQAWGGTNTIARALKSIEEQHYGTSGWKQLQAKIVKKVVIMASGFQDRTYDEYIAPFWPKLEVRANGVLWTTYNCNLGKGNVRGLPDAHVYFTGDWIRKNIEIGPYGSLYRSWLDGQHMRGDPLDVFGNTTAHPIPKDLWCKPLGPYAFLGEGDDGTYFPFLPSGIQDPSDPNLGGWGGRMKQNISSLANLWVSVSRERAPNGTKVADWGTERFISAVQNDFAARIQWTMTSKYSEANHPPSVEVANGKTIQARAGSNVRLQGVVSDPDGDRVTMKWWQYFEEGTYKDEVRVNSMDGHEAMVKVPKDAKSGQTISIILEGTDDGHFPLTRYARVIIEVQ